MSKNINNPLKHFVTGFAAVCFVFAWGVYIYMEATGMITCLNCPGDLEPVRIATSPLDQKSGQWMLLFQQSQQADYLWLELSQDQTRLEGQGQEWSISIELEPRPDGTLGAFFGAEEPQPVFLTVKHQAVIWGMWGLEKFYLFKINEYPYQKSLLIPN